MKNNLLKQLLGSSVFKLAIIGIIGVIISVLLDSFIFPGRGLGLIPFSIAGYAILYVFSASLIDMIIKHDSGFISAFCSKNRILMNVILSVVVTFLFLLPFFLTNN